MGVNGKYGPMNDVPLPPERPFDLGLSSEPPANADIAACQANVAADNKNGVAKVGDVKAFCANPVNRASMAP